MLQNQNETIKEIFHFINEEIQDIVENNYIRTDNKKSLIRKQKEYLHHLLEINSLTMKEVLLYPLEELIKTIENNTSQDYYLYCKNSLTDVWQPEKKNFEVENNSEAMCEHIAVDVPVEETVCNPDDVENLPEI